MATGDLRNNMMKLQQGLKSVKFKGNFDVFRISKGDPSAFLPLIHHVLLESPTLSKYFTSKEYDLYGKKDARFLETVYQLLRDEFHYKPALTQTQFLSTGFSERKCILVSDIIKHARELEMDLQRKRGRKDRTPESSPGETRNNSGESVDHIPKQILDNPPSRFLSEQAWLQHVQRSLNGMEPILNYPKPLEHPLGDMEDSLFENRSSNLDSEPIVHRSNGVHESPYSQPFAHNYNLSSPSIGSKSTPKRGFEPLWTRPMEQLKKQIQQQQDHHQLVSHVTSVTRTSLGSYKCIGARHAPTQARESRTQTVSDKRERTLATQRLGTQQTQRTRTQKCGAQMSERARSDQGRV